jgi:hypothetical protein
MKKLILLILLSTPAWGAPITEQNQNPKTIESRGNFIALKATVADTTNSYVRAYNWLSANECKDKMIIVENTGANTLSYSLYMAGLNTGATLVPVTIGGTSQVNQAVTTGAVKVLEFSDPASRVTVDVKSTTPGSPTGFSVQASCFKN